MKAQIGGAGVFISSVRQRVAVLRTRIVRRAAFGTVGVVSATERMSREATARQPRA